jgi:ferredoxin-NADP reductase
MQQYSTKLTEKKELVSDMFQLRFAKPAGFAFEAGQFIQVQVPNGDKFLLRSYSLSSTPEDDFIELCVKILEDGKASAMFLAMEEGEEMQFRGPVGRFVVNDEHPANFFVATGAGIAPIIGMIRDQLENKKDAKQLHLLFGVRYDHDIFWIERLDQLTSKFANFTYQLTLSRPSTDWKGLQGRVTEHLQDHPKDHGFYICGNGGMVKDVRTLLINNDVDLKSIHLEIF